MSNVRRRHTETVVHVVLQCPALAAKVWPALWSILAGLGLDPDNNDEGTLLLCLKMPNDSNRVATSLALLRQVLVMMSTCSNLAIAKCCLSVSFAC